MFHFALGKLGAAVRAGTGSAGGVVPLFSRDYEATGPLGADATFTRASTATIIDHEGVIRTVPSGAARFNGLRYVRNLFDEGQVIVTGGTATYTSISYNEISVSNIDSNIANQVNIELDTDFNFFGVPVVGRIAVKGEGANIGKAIWLRFRRRTGGTGADEILSSVILTSDWVTYQLAWTGNTDNLGAYFTIVGATVNPASQVLVKEWQVENATGRADTTTPSEYVSVGVLSAPYHGANVDGVKYFATENGNTVTDNVVTEGTGAAITGGALLMEPAATNYLLNSSTPATQTTGSLGTGNYVLWVEGSGSAAVTAGTATITGGGTATDGTPNTFTVTGAGTVTVTVTGTLDRFQLEAGSTPTSYIPTSGSTVTRAADSLSYSGIAADNETRAITDAGTVDVDDWDGVVDATIAGADNIAEISSITVYTTGERPA